MTFMLIKIKRSGRLFENQNIIKTIWEKIGFSKFIWKKWNLEGYLKIEVLRIKFKNWNFGNWNWKKLEFLKLFESWNYEN